MISTSIALDAERELYRSSLFHTAKFLLGNKDVTERTHGEIIDCLESPSKRKLICVPRGCLKSTIACVAYPIWLLINNPNLRILIDSELYTNSKNFIRQIKAYLESPMVTNVFGEFKSKSNWSEGEITISKRTKALKEASIVAGGIGTTKVGAHFEVIIGDDYNSNKNSNTPEGCEKVIDHYKYNTSILEPTGTYVIIGTRYSENDIIGHIMNNEINKQGLLEKGL